MQAIAGKNLLNWIDSAAVVGLWEVVKRYGYFREQFRAALREIANINPDAVVLIDYPGFNLRLARTLRKKSRALKIIYYISPQVWAWNRGRIRQMARFLDLMLCIFPFEEQFFHKYGVPTTFIGHPLARIVKPSLTRAEFFEKCGLAVDDRVVVLLPGSRHGEVARHMPYLLDAVKRMQAATRMQAGGKMRFILALPAGFGAEHATFWEPTHAASIQLIEGLTWDCLAHAEIALAASGTVTIRDTVTHRDDPVLSQD